MNEILKKNHTELRAKIKKYDEALTKLITPKTAKTIHKIITDFLSQHE